MSRVRWTGEAPQYGADPVYYVRGGLGTTDHLELCPVRIRGRESCTGCGRRLDPGTMIFRRIREVYTTGEPWCPTCAAEDPEVGIWAVVDAGPDRGRR